LMPATTEAMVDWDGSTEPTEGMAAALVADLIVAKKEKTIGKVATRVNRELSGTRSLFTKTARSAKKLKPPYMEALANRDKDWADVETWKAMKTASRTYTPAYIAAALDRKMLADGSIVQQSKERRIHVQLFTRTMEISFLVTIFCLILGYPIAFLMASLPLRTSNLLLILVLLPFWTSLLVRTTAWIAMLQAQGVMNDLFVVFGLAVDEDRFSLIYNKTGTLIAMTHILLPFMILPLFSVMKTIPPTYVRAAKSMGATDWTAFWRVYFPQSVPGIGAGALLVFILAIGYYITPALVGGQDGQMISNIIDFHMRKSLNWNLAAALGLVMLVFVMFLFWLYDRVVGIDNMKLG
jgi:putative spermidine/putrescine transport system permease protein